MCSLPVLSFCFLALLGVTTGQQQVPICMPTSDQQFTGINQEHPQNRVITEEEKLVSGCPLITFHLPRDNQNTDYIRYRNYVPRMPSATVCTWIETTNYDNAFATIASYAIPRHNNAYLMGFYSSTRVSFHIMDPEFPNNVSPLNVNDKFHICHWFSSENRTSGFYVNGKSIITFGYRGTVVAGGGDLILGQDQDETNARRLDATQAFQGNITNFMIWPRVLTEFEIYDLVNFCLCPIDHSIVFSLDRVELFGQASYSIPKTCPTLQP